MLKKLRKARQWLIWKILKKRERLGLTGDEIIGQSFIFFVAGYETTATTLTWALYELARDQELQEKCRREATNIDFSKQSELRNDVIPVIDATLKVFNLINFKNGNFLA